MPKKNFISIKKFEFKFQIHRSSTKKQDRDYIYSLIPNVEHKFMFLPMHSHKTYKIEVTIVI